MPKSNSYKQILDREYGIKASQHFKDAVDLLNEVLDYGSHLLPSAYASSPRDIQTTCNIPVQLGQLLVHLDGIGLLLSAGNCFSAGLQIRSILEIAHTMEWLLTDAADTQGKVDHLYVANLRRRRQWQSIGIAGTPEATRRPDASGRLSPTPEQLKEFNEEIRGIDEILAKPEYSGINAKFQCNYARRGFDKPWYEVYGAPSGKLSIRNIADIIGRLDEYDYVYRSLSAVTHGGDIFKSITVGQMIYFNSVREPQNIPKVARAALSFAFRVYKMILEQYLPCEIEAFNKLYQNEWRGRYLKEYSVTVSPIDTII